MCQRHIRMKKKGVYDNNHALQALPGGANIFPACFTKSDDCTQQNKKKENIEKQCKGQKNWCW